MSAGLNDTGTVDFFERTKAVAPHPLSESCFSEENRLSGDRRRARAIGGSIIGANRRPIRSFGVQGYMIAEH
jgi:hypothetical protein